MNSVIPILFGKEAAWFTLATFLSITLETCLFLLIESFGFPTVSADSSLAVGGLTPLALMIALFARDLSFLLCAVQRMKNESEKIIEWKETAPKLPLSKKIGLGIIAAAAILAFDYLQESILYLFFEANEVINTYWDNAKNFTAFEKAALFFFMVISGPIVEELYFREAMAGSIFRAGFPKFAVFFSSAVFALVHFDFLHIFAYLISAAVFAGLYLKTKSVFVPIVSHMTVNLFVFALMFMF